MSLSLRHHRHLERWLEIGNSVPWMYLAEDPPFNAESFRICTDVRDLIRQLLASARHALGMAFALDDVCLINLNSLPGADEWLVIKGDSALGNITLYVRDTSGNTDLIATELSIRELLERLQQQGT